MTKRLLIIIMILGLVSGVIAQSTSLRLRGLTTAGIGNYEVVYIIGNKVCAKADANLIEPVLGMFMGTSGEIWIEGKVTCLDWTLTTRPTWEAGDTLWLSEVAGEITDTVPTTDGSMIQCLGCVISIDGAKAVIYFKPSDLIIIN